MYLTAPLRGHVRRGRRGLGDLPQDREHFTTLRCALLILALRQNTAAASDDEEDDLAQLQAIEQKLLMHDPTFTPKHTHAALTTQRSALMSAFRPLYQEGDVEGASLLSSCPPLLLPTNAPLPAADAPSHRCAQAARAST